jgi:hypothetical protein
VPDKVAGLNQHHWLANRSVRTASNSSNVPIECAAPDRRKNSLTHSRLEIWVTGGQKWWHTLLQRKSASIGILAFGMATPAHQPNRSGGFSAHI